MQTMRYRHFKVFRGKDLHWRMPQFPRLT